MTKPSIQLGILLFVVLALSITLTPSANAQGEMRGLYILDGRGPVYHQGDPPTFPGEPFLGIDIARDLAPILDTDNEVKGYFILDGLGNVYEVGGARLNGATPTFFGIDIARDMEVLQPGMFPVTITTPASAVGFYILDGFGTVHPAGSATTIPGTAGGVFDADPNTPDIDPFFGFDIARDFELSYNVDGPTVGQVNGYFILDGFGGIHAAGGALGTMIRSTPGDDISIPFFGFDIARAIEVTPSGRGIYLLDGFGGVHKLGDAFKAFPLGGPAATPIWGWDVAEDIELITNGADQVLGYYVLSAFGDVSGAGIAQRAPYPGRALYQDIARDLETTKWLEGETIPQINH